MSLNAFGQYVPDLNHPTPGTGSGAGDGAPGGVPGMNEEFYWDYTNKILYVKDTVAGAAAWREIIA